ncbi:Conserved hypothetical protein CHP02231 [Aphelenchoides avenae]|nr:Conserved hypothetical protein CHP02231 [Aphelenchus avenae]
MSDFVVVAESSVPRHVQKFESKELPAKAVTIFTDRAEVKRTFALKLEAGLTDVVVANVTQSADTETVRVDGRGPVTIHEVQCKTEHVVQDEIDNPKVRQLREELKLLKANKGEVEARGRAYEKRLAAVNQLVEKPADTALAFGFDVEGIEKGIDRLLNFHLDRSVQIEAEIRTAKNEADELQEQISKLEREINEGKSRNNVAVKSHAGRRKFVDDDDLKELEEELRELQELEELQRWADGWPESTQQRNVVITVESAEQTDAELELTYQVHGAYWRPSYDVRVRANADKPSMKVYYFGKIHQASDEDWNDVELTLSTAQPRLGGSLPKIGTLKAKLQRVEPVFPQSQLERKKAARDSLFGTSSKRMMKACNVNGDLGDWDDQSVPMSRRGALHSTMESQQHVLSTTFIVPQKKTIPSDSADHKVTITVLEFEPLFRYDVVPSKNTNVFLTASVINSSDYPLLAGPASIYMDGSFSNKTHIKAVNVGDKFDCPIGVDPTVNVDYKLAHIFHQQAGMISKSSVTVREQKIVVKNAKQNQLVLLTVVEHVPKATDEKIKVKLMHPEVKSSAPATALNSSRPSISSEADLKPHLEAPEVGVKLNDANNLEWTVLVSPNEEKDLVVKWTVEVPANETVELREDF